MAVTTMRPLIRSDATTAAAIALGVGIALALVVDLSSPRGKDARLATTAPSAAQGENLAQRMEAQIAAGAPGVALALEQAAKDEERVGAAVSAAHAHAIFELGDAPSALRSVREAQRICEITKTCGPGERALLERLDLVIGAIVGAGVVDPKKEPKKVDDAIHGLLPGAGFLK
jgi:hypothetical protein